MFKKLALAMSGVSIALATTGLVLAGCSQPTNQEITPECPPTYPPSIVLGTVEQTGTDIGFKIQLYLEKEVGYKMIHMFYETKYDIVEKLAGRLPMWIKRETTIPNPNENGAFYEWVKFGSYGEQTNR